jgi:uncharacterized membrane protein YjfL (UPF0719 family)
MIQQILVLAGQGLVYVAIAYILIYGNKAAADWYGLKKDLDANHAIEEDSNLAVGLRRAGLYLGLGIAFEGVISGPSSGSFIIDVAAVITYGLIASVFFLGARVINDWVVLGSMSNTTEIKEGNVAVGLVEFGAFIATGLIARASMLGEGGGYTTAVVFFLIGQALLLAVALGYEIVSPYKVRAAIKDGNAAAGLRVGGLMIALAVGINGAVAYDFVSWTHNLSFLAIDGGIVILFMIGTSLVVDRFFLPGTNIVTEIERDKNVAAISVVVAMNIVAGLVISASII